MEKNKFVNTWLRFKSIILLLVLFVNINGICYGQEITDPVISVNFNDTQLKDVFEILEIKTKCTFSYLVEEISLDERVTINKQEILLSELLKILSKKCGLKFTRLSNIITVKKIQSSQPNKLKKKVGTIRGTVRDSLSSEILPYTNIYIKEMNTGVSTDNRGFFILPSVPVGREVSVIISYLGYATKTIKVLVKENKITHVDVNLSKSAIEMENVLVTGERIKEAEVTAQKITIKEIENMINGVETDVMRSIQSLPGVQSAGDVSAKYYVRGGASNENLVLLNETPIYNPFHALGIFSVIDPDMINSLEFYKGGFGARFGGRLSSVMDIITKDGNRNSYDASIALSQLTVKSSIEGPIPDGSFIITGRKSHSDDIIKKFTNDKSVPIDFYDASFKISYSNPDFLPISKFTFFGFASMDKIDYQDKFHADYNWSNSNIGFNWFIATKDNPLFAAMTLYYSKFKGSEMPNATESRHMENEVKDITFKTDFNYVFNNRNEFYGGVNINFIKSNLYVSNSYGQIKDIGSEGTLFNGYAGLRLLAIKNIKADIGSRFNLVSLADASTKFFEPRLNLIYSAQPNLSIKAAWGIYQQEFVTISDEDEILSLFEPWIITPDYLNTSSSTHYITGIEYFLTEKIKINMEGYYKKMKDLAVINDNVIYPSDKPLVNANGKSYGAELTMNYKEKWFLTQLSYSYSWTTRKIENTEYHPRYDSRNNVKLYVIFNLGNDWSAGVSWNYSSGLPFTRILGYSSKFNPMNISNPNSVLLYYEYFPILADRNATTLPDYHRMDLNVSKKFDLNFIDLSIELNIINVYDRANFFYFDLTTGERVNMLPFFPSIDLRVDL